MKDGEKTGNLSAAEQRMMEAATNFAVTPYVMQLAERTGEVIIHVDGATLEARIAGFGTGAEKRSFLKPSS